MDKLNITEGEWKLTDNFGITFDDVYPHEMSIEEIEANAKAIVTSVNNTYKRGINPEAVPDMAEALQKCRKTLYELEREVSTRDIDRVNDSISQATKALKKAKL